MPIHVTCMTTKSTWGNGDEREASYYGQKREANAEAIGTTHL